MAWVVELNGVDPSDGLAKTKVFSLGAGYAFTDSTFAPTGLVSWRSPSQKVDVSKDGGVTLTADAGQIVISNLPADIGSAGPWDVLRTWAWHGRRANLYYTPDTWANRTLIATGTLQQPVAPLNANGSSVTSTLQFPLRDPRSPLSAPLQPTKYLGNNAAGTGVEGDSDLKNKPKPVLYGVVSNIPGVLVCKEKNVWQLADKSAGVLCAREGGAAFTAGTARGTLASLLSTTPTAGTYDTYAGSEGTFVRLCGTPQYPVTFDAYEGATSADRTHAQIWKRIRTERCDNVAGDITAASVTATDALAANEVGFWKNDETTRLDLINEVLTSLSGYEVLGFDSKWSIAQLVAPSGTTVLDFLTLTPTSTLKTKSRPIAGLTMVRPGFAPEGCPPYRVNVNWGKNYTVMSRADFVGGVAVQAPRLIDKFGLEWRTEKADNTAIWNPATSTGPYPQAPQLTVDTGYQPGADNLTCPHAATEATRLIALYSAMPGQFQLDFIPAVTDRILPGDVVSVTYGQMGLSGGPLFRVLQAGWVLDEKGPQATLVVGFQV